MERLLYFHGIETAKYYDILDTFKSFGVQTFKVSYELRASNKQMEKLSVSVKDFIYIYDESYLYADDSIVYKYLINETETIDRMQALINAAKLAGISKIFGKFWLDCESDQFLQILTTLVEKLDISGIELWD